MDYHINFKLVILAKRFLVPVLIALLAALLLFAYSLPSQAQTRQDVLREIQRNNIPHPHIVLAQARLESGNFKSSFYLRTNNLFGIKRNGKYVVFKHWRYSIQSYKNNISNRYKGGDYYAFLTRINYATDQNYTNKLKEIVKN